MRLETVRTSRGDDGAAAVSALAIDRERASVDGAEIANVRRNADAFANESYDTTTLAAFPGGFFASGLL